MDRLDAMRLFTRVVERRSFTQAARSGRAALDRDAGDPAAIEERLGVRLLQRTTRTVRPTLDGEAYYRRCLAILDDVEDAEGAFSGAVPKRHAAGRGAGYARAAFPDARPAAILRRLSRISSWR
jgi:DNA-binding transcriptional LysR family regulator